MAEWLDFMRGNILVLTVARGVKGCSSIMKNTMLP